MVTDQAQGVPTKEPMERPVAPVLAQGPLAWEGAKWNPGHAVISLPTDTQSGNRALRAVPQVWSEDT